jgi:hypothetical protein
MLNLRLAATLDAYVAQAFFRAISLVQAELLFDPELIARVNEVCGNWNEEDRDLSRPPEWAEEHAPAA